MKYKHYVFLDKETDIAGLEPFELLVVVGLPLGIGIILFIISPIKIPIAFAIVVSIVFLYIFVRKKKNGKKKGHIYRKVIYDLTGIKKIY